MSEPLLHSGDYETALKYSQEGLEMAKETENQGLINHCQIYVCTILVHTKQYEKGRPLVEEVLIEAEKLNQLHVIEGAYHLLGDCTLGMGDYEEGEKRYARGIEVSYGQGNVMYAATDIQGVGFAVAGQGRLAKAIRLDAAARVKYAELGIVIDGMLAFWDEWIETYIGGAKKEVGEVLAQQYVNEGKAMSFEEAVAYALDFEKD
jgi:tetratricopeptide (TPR) repeat protein